MNYSKQKPLKGLLNIKKEWKNIIKFAKVNYLIKGMGRVPQTLFFEILNENSIFYIFF